MSDHGNFERLLSTVYRAMRNDEDYAASFKVLVPSGMVVKVERQVPFNKIKVEIVYTPGFTAEDIRSTQEIVVQCGLPQPGLFIEDSLMAYYFREVLGEGYERRQ